MTDFIVTYLDTYGEPRAVRITAYDRTEAGETAQAEDSDYATLVSVVLAPG